MASHVPLTVWCPVADHEVCVAALEVRDDLLRDGVACDVTLKLHHALHGRHWLQIDCHQLWQVHGPAHHHCGAIEMLCSSGASVRVHGWRNISAEAPHSAHCTRLARALGSHRAAAHCLAPGRAA